MPEKKFGIGIVGCGNISGIYFKNLKRFPHTEVRACSDLDIGRARKAANEHGIPRACSTDELLAMPEIDAVLNLTTPQSHVAVNLQALRAGKHVYCEKPFALDTSSGMKVLSLAKKTGKRSGCAPDTVLGGGIQTCRKLIDDGAIGRPIAATAFMMCRGHESWHPDPEFYYKKGGGPMLDMGPYYLTCLVTLLGPMKSVSGSAKVSFPERLITSQPKNGTRIKVDTPTHIAGTIEFVNGAVATVITSFDIVRSDLPPVQIHGEAGSLSVPDPNTFGGPVRLFQPGAKEWKDIPLTHGHAENFRGIGLADMLDAEDKKRPSRASGELSLHVLEAMLAFELSSRSGKRIGLKSTCLQPAAFRPGLSDGKLE
jgi:predicted dehydrogenase